MNDLAERIAKLRELEAEATETKWTSKPFQNSDDDDEWLVMFPSGEDCSVLYKQDADFIVYLRNNALPIIEALESENAKLQGKDCGVHRR